MHTFVLAVLFQLFFARPPAGFARVEERRVSASHADAYYDCVRRKWIPEVRERAGNHAVYVLRKAEADATRFVLITIDETRPADASPQCGESELVETYVAPVALESVQ